jgi:frataxin
MSRNALIRFNCLILQNNIKRVNKVFLGTSLLFALNIRNISHSQLNRYVDEKKSYFSIQDTSNNVNSSQLIYEQISNQTLESLAEQFDELGDEHMESNNDYDVSFSNGVLTIKFGANIGTYVLNKQSPNQQIWLSSPSSGPKRFDLTKENEWIYKRTGQSLQCLLNDEISKCIGKPVRFKC